MKRNWVGMLAWACFGAAAWAQDGTLPPVEVRPSPTQTPEGTPAPGDAPAVDSGFDPGEFPFDDSFGDGGAFPSLTEQGFGFSPGDPGGLNSLFRGEKSLLDQAQFGSVIDRQTLDERQASDMYRALQQETGVLLQQTGRGQLSPFIRGLTGQQVLILVDGIRVNNSVLRSGPNQYAATFDPGQIERIEVLRGSSAALYGSDAIGGAINIVTRSADIFNGNYNGGSFKEYVASADRSSYSRANLEGSWQGAGVFGGASYLGVQELDIGGGRGTQAATDYDQFACDLKYSSMLNENNFFTAAYQHFYQNDLPRSDRFLPFVANRRPNNTVGTQSPTFFDQQRDLAYTRFQGLAYNENPLFDAYSVTLSWQRTTEGSTQFNMNNNTPAATVTNRIDGQFNDDQLGAQVSLVKDFVDYGKVTWGVDYYYEDIDAWRRQTTGNPTPTPQYPADAVADRAGAFLMWDVNLTQKLNAVASVRYENYDTSGTTVISNTTTRYARAADDFIGSLGLNYAVTDEFRLVGGFYEGFRAPTIDDLVSSNTTQQNTVTTPGNFGINPEHSYTYEVGFKYNDDRWRIQCYEWWTDFTNYIGRETRTTTTGGNAEFLVNQQAHLQGTELYVEYLLTETWSVWGNGAQTYGKIANGQPFPRIPPLQGWLGLKWRDTETPRYFEVYTWMVNEVTQSSYNQFNLTDVRFNQGGTPGYVTLNVRGGTSFGENLNHRVSVTLENLTDTYYRVLGSGVDGPGFNALAGYEYVW